MSTYLGGDIIEVVCKHSLGTFRFQTKANEDYTIDFGGFRANDDANSVTGGGTMINQVNRVRWSVEGPLAYDFVSQNESKNLPLLAAHPEEGVWTISHISGVVWKGKGRPVGDINASTNTAQGTMKLAGSGMLEPI